MDSGESWQSCPSLEASQEPFSKRGNNIPTENLADSTAAKSVRNISSDLLANSEVYLWGTWVAQLVERLLIWAQVMIWGHGIKPCVGFHPEYGACLSLSLFLSPLHLPPVCTLSLSKQTNKNKQNK